MSPWSAAADVEHDAVKMTVLLTTDPGPMREFRPYLDVTLDEPHAIILFAELGLALQALSAARAASRNDNVVPFGPRS